MVQLDGPAVTVAVSPASVHDALSLASVMASSLQVMRDLPMISTLASPSVLG